MGIEKVNSYSDIQVNISSVKELGKCHHCSSAIVDLVENDRGEQFCCHGCECVNSILKGNGLNLYYDMAKDEKRDIPRSFELLEYSYLKDLRYLNEYEADVFFNFFVEGVDCLACTWLFDNLESLSPYIVTAQYSHETYCLKIKVSEPRFLFDALAPIIQLGYKLSPVRNSTHLSLLNRKKGKSNLIRLAVAMILMGNISFFSFSDYLGLKGEFLDYFRALSSFLFILIPTYCSAPFYSSSLKMLKSRQISLDLPISLSIITGSVLSYYNFFQGLEHLYFDSIASFVFLILSTRYLLNIIYSKASETRNIDELIGAGQVELIKKDKLLKRHSSLLVDGDYIKLQAGRISPIDGVIVKGVSYFNESLLSGESTAIKRGVDDHIFRGSYNYSQELVVRVRQDKDTKLINQSIKEFEAKKAVFSNFSSLTRNYSLALIILYFIVGIALFSLLDFYTAVERFLALSIICCPCALGIGIPLTSIMANRSLVKEGVLINDSNFFEKIKNIDHVYMDKTGTITTGIFDVEVLSGQSHFLSMLVAIESLSKHPIARSIVNAYPQEEFLEVENFQEVIGVGAKASINGQEYFVKSGSEIDTVVLVENERIVLTLKLKEQILKNEIKNLREISEINPVTILSGDRLEKVRDMKMMIDSPNVDAFGLLSPLQKRNHIAQKKSLFIGDGLNDIPAMTKSHVSISFNASDLVNSACECTFLRPSLALVLRVFKISTRVEKIVIGNVAFSAIYNIAGACLASLGYITPLFAAVFMPFSSISIILLTTYRARTI